MKAKFLINPFEDISSNKLLIIGIVSYILSSLLAFYSSNHFLGFLSIKSGADSSLLLSFYNNGLAIVLLTLAVFIFARFKNSHVRFVDVLNVVMISRIVMYLILLVLADPFLVKNTLTKVELAILDDDFLLQTLTSFDKSVLVLIGLISVFGLFYFFYFFVSGVRFIINSKQRIDIYWIIFLVFLLEFVITFLGLNIK